MSVARTTRSSSAGPLAALARLAPVVLIALLVVGVRPAAAAEPTNLRNQLTDDANVLSASDEAEVRDALDALQRATDVQLWAWYTTTTEGQNIVDFAAETAEMSSLGGTDLLLVIALDDRAYGFSSPPGFPLSDSEIEQLLSRELEPSLRDEDYAGAIIAVTRRSRSSSRPRRRRSTPRARPRPRPAATARAAVAWVAASAPF